MNKITIYDLIGLIKDGKAPKKIKWANKIYIINEIERYYRNLYNDADFLFESIFGSFNDYEALTQKIEILDEEEFEDIEELNLDTDELKENEIVRAIDYLIEGKLNQLIRNQEWLCKKIFQISERLKSNE